MPLEKILQPISEGTPCGHDLSGSQLHIEMLSARGGNKRQSFSGDGTGESEDDDADWKLVKKNAQSLLQDTHDIEISTHLCIALLHTNSFSGLAEGLQLIRNLLEQHWECVHPVLDLDYPEDPALERSNTLAELGGNSFINSLRKHPVISDRMLGSYSITDLQMAYSENPPEGAPKPEHVEGAFTEVGLDAVKAIKDSVNVAIAEAEAIENIFKEKTGPTSYPDLSGLYLILKKISLILTGKVQEEEPEMVEVETDEIAVNTVNVTQSAPNFTAGEINSREEVVKAIDKICEYYQTNEPSSPIPILLERAKRLTNKNFIELLEDLSPEGLDKAKIIFGTSE